MGSSDLAKSLIVHNMYPPGGEPNSDNCLDFIFVAPPCEKVIFSSDKNYIIPAIRKFMLDMPGHVQVASNYRLSPTGLRP